MALISHGSTVILMNSMALTIREVVEDWSKKSIL